MNVFQKAREMDINRIAAARIRARYLLDNVAVYLEDGSDLSLVWAWEELDECLNILDACRFDIVHNNESTGRITDTMISIAKTVPVESLVEFIRGKTRAWCHEDTNPSAYHGTRKNIVVCPVCDKKFGPIDILMHRDGMSWKEAVLCLNHR